MLCKCILFDLYKNVKYIEIFRPYILKKKRYIITIPFLTKQQLLFKLENVIS
ncbi:hypothetical protein GLOIN_2v1556448 [Rhizophagus irregularis DAOM 181602=DAOM 197198]|uniref:Uncharacterized protein n=1 Tax=Rhizophagus irregularis (strain DAOM 181602 / DAOM 197198 / MUCL 43194) TaxID=747089 RepID=A0A2P4QFN3_RHIID|nr:hypothetical protein GLOIN_2v1556448 [Rhizophagus irregularis DAOM 181602=DAOM 197198]POG76451.1 hypothetical protein GLOIN_2v1556448 [Rhizophagus irregularis DAOM 181602=DAOM 197198]|eukprot:XP_025183317.1 hypothetical protein GLOIN_2v1556448 [Rhizophagus irregularis DAOM 181602=DAOM 197198]